VNALKRSRFCADRAVACVLHSASVVMQPNFVTVQSSSYRIVAGRRHEGVLAPESRPGASVLGDYFARAAYLEGESAVAFERLGRELEVHGAPDALVERCARASLDEDRHARLLGKLAEEHGVCHETPPPQSLRIRPLVDIALANIVEGFVRQTYGATVATHRARAAGDFQIRRVMEEIAADESLHAELAFDIAIWLQGAIDPFEAAFVENALRHAVVALADEIDVEVETELSERAGVPSRRKALAIWSGLSKRVWHGMSDCVWRAAG
jgi:hypothetical protein